MPAPITDGLTLLRTLRDSGTPRKMLDLGLPVVSEDPNAPAEAVLKALQDGGAKEGTLNKAIQLMQTGELQSQRNDVDPLDVLAIERGDAVPVAAPQSVSQIVGGPEAELAKVKAEATEALQEQGEEIYELRRALGIERQARLDAESQLDALTAPVPDGNPPTE
jgi:hypothetical protein